MLLTLLPFFLFCNRYAIGVLREQGIFLNIEPMFFMTFATPHLGVRRPQHKRTFNSGSSLLHSPSLFIFSLLTHFLLFFTVMNFFTGSWFLGKTGRQLVYEDSPVKPILTLLASPHDIFYQGSLEHLFLFSFSYLLSHNAPFPL